MKNIRFLISILCFLSVMSCNKDCEQDNPCDKCDSYSENCINESCVCKEEFSLFEGQCISVGREGDLWVKTMVQNGNGCYGLEKTYFQVGEIDFRGLDSFQGNVGLSNVGIMIRSTLKSDMLLWEQNGSMSPRPEGGYNLSFILGVASSSFNNYSRPTELKYENSHFWLEWDGTFDEEITEFNAWIKLYECQDDDYDVYYPKREVLLDSCFMSWEVFE